MLHQNSVVSDALATAVSGSIVLSVLLLFEETAKRGLFDQVRIWLLPPSLASWMICMRTMPSHDDWMFRFTHEIKLYSDTK